MDFEEYKNRLDWGICIRQKNYSDPLLNSLWRHIKWAHLYIGIFPHSSFWIIEINKIKNGGVSVLRSRLWSVVVSRFISYRCGVKSPASRWVKVRGIVQAAVLGNRVEDRRHFPWSVLVMHG